jgi:hypothetical protein
VQHPVKCSRNAAQHSMAQYGAQEVAMCGSQPYVGPGSHAGAAGQYSIGGVQQVTSLTCCCADCGPGRQTLAPNAIKVRV